MTVCGIVAEYNPLHNGHLYHIAQTRAAGASHIIAVMSGNFVQRAEPAILSKFLRAEMAARCGADLVIELPVPYALGASERFARGAISLLAALGCVDMLSFGSEYGAVSPLAAAAQAMDHPAVVVRAKALREQGLTYPKAQREAVAERFGLETAAILDGPNNLLAAEYLRALAVLAPDIAPFTVRRRGVGHDGVEGNGAFASAARIRNGLAAGQDVSAWIPEASAEIISKLTSAGAVSGGLEKIERAVLLKMREFPSEHWAALPGCADGLGNRLHRAAARADSLEELYQKAKTARYTMSRVRRAVTCALLDLDESYDFPPPYARLLAIGPGGEELLNKMAKTASLPVSASLRRLMAAGPEAKKTALAEARATDLFGLTLGRVAPVGMDFTTKLYKV